MSISEEKAVKVTAGNYSDEQGKAIAGVVYYSAETCQESEKVEVNVGDDVTSTAYYVKTPAGIPTYNTANESVSDSTTSMTSLDADDAVKVEVYIWYEGQDAACKSTNAVTLDKTIFSIEFTVAG